MKIYLRIHRLKDSESTFTVLLILYSDMQKRRHKWNACSVGFGHLTESSKSPASIAKSNKQLFGYEQVAKRIANIRLTLFIWNVFLRLYKLFLQI